MLTTAKKKLHAIISQLKNAGFTAGAMIFDDQAVGGAATIVAPGQSRLGAAMKALLTLLTLPYWCTLSHPLTPSLTPLTPSHTLSHPLTPSHTFSHPLAPSHTLIG